MATVYMMIGLPGSGKSYVARRFNCPIVSSDAIRKKLFGNEEDQSHNQEVFNTVHSHIQSYLTNGKDCVYDATNLSRKRRISFLKSLPAGTRSVAVVIATDYDIILKQNAERDRHVPEEVIRRMMRTMQLPDSRENWSRILIIPHPKNKKTYYDYLSETLSFNQDNPHHTLTLGKHMVKAGEYVLNNWEEYNITEQQATKCWLAAMLHDIGKPLCKTYTLWSGKTDSHAHYYNHAEVGAYLFACSLFAFNEDCRDRYSEVFLLIKLHMLAFEQKENTNDYIKELYGEEFLKMYKLVHDADLAAH